MLITKPSFRAKVSNWMGTAGATYWDVAELGLAQVWFLVTVGRFSKGRSKGKAAMLLDSSTTYLIVESQKVLDMAKNPSETDKVISVLAVIPPVLNKSSDWEMHKARAIWRNEKRPDDGIAGIPFDVVEISDGSLIPTFPVGETIEREKLALLAQFTDESKS